MLDILLIIIAMTSCIDSQAREIIDTAKEAAEMANDIAKKLQPGNLCFKNDDCYPFNEFNRKQDNSVIIFLKIPNKFCLKYSL